MSSIVIPSVVIGDLESTPVGKEIPPPYIEEFGARYTRILETPFALGGKVFISERAYGVLQNSKTRAPFVCDVEIVPVRDLIECDVDDLPRQANVRRAIFSQKTEELCAPETMFYLVRDHYKTIHCVTPRLYLAMSPLSYNREGHFIFVFRSNNTIDAVSSQVQRDDVHFSHWVFARNKRPIA